MKPVFFFYTRMLCVLITNPKGDCVRIMKTVSADSISYFKADQIRLKAINFKDTSLQLKLNTGTYTFIRDTSKWYLFKADKDNKSFYVIDEIHPDQLADTSIFATIYWQAFDKKKQTNSTKRFKLNNFSISLSAINSFTTTAENYNRFFFAKK